MTEFESFEEFASRRQAADRCVQVFVQGYPHKDPPKGRAMTSRVSHLLRAGAGEIIRIGPTDDVLIGEEPAWSVLEFTIDDTRAEDLRVRNAGAVSRAHRFHVVVFARTLPKQAYRMMDVRIDAESHSIYRLQRDGASSRDVYEVSIPRLTSPATETEDSDHEK